MILRAEADLLLPDPLLDDVVQPHERPAADEQDVGGVHLQELLLGMLASALGGYVADGALQDLQQRLLNPLARDVAGDGRVLALAGDLVDLVDVDDAPLRLLDVVIGVLQQVDDDVLDILAHVARLGQVGGVGDGERDIQDLGQGLRQQGLAAAGGSQQQDVRLAQLHVIGAHLGVDALVVVVNGDGQDLLGALLPDHVVVKNVLDLRRLGHRSQAEVLRLLLDLLGDDVVAEADALVADVNGGTGDQLLDLALAFSTKRTGEILVLVTLAIGRHSTNVARTPRPGAQENGGCPKLAAVTGRRSLFRAVKLTGGRPAALTCPTPRPASESELRR